jgi:hypothetical protein
MSYRDTIANQTGIDIEVVIAEVPGVAADMKESTEEIKVAEFYGETSVPACDGRREEFPVSPGCSLVDLGGSKRRSHEFVFRSNPKSCQVYGDSR